MGMSVREMLVVEEDLSGFDTVESVAEVILSALRCSTVMFPADWAAAGWFPTLVRVLESSGVSVVVPAGTVNAASSGDVTPDAAAASDAPAAHKTGSAGSDGSDAHEKAPHEEAVELVRGPRGDYYDTPFENFTRIGRIWSGVLHSKLRGGEQVTPEDVALCMIGVKMSREAFRHKRDNIVDMHGYLLTLDDVVQERRRGE